jgi:hypothetical protein
MQGKKTHATIATLVSVVLAKVLSKYLPAPVGQMVAELLTDEVVAVVVPLLGAGAMHFRSRAGSFIDAQAVKSAGPPV